MNRDELINEVEAFLERLCAIGDVSGIMSAFGNMNPKVKELDTETLQDIYNEYIKPDGK